MSMEAYDFREIQRKSMRVELAKDIKVRVFMPSVALVEVLEYLKDAFVVLARDNASQDEVDEAYDTMYKCFAAIVSCNIEMKTFEPEYLRDTLEIGPFQIIDFINSYSDFYNSELNRKN